MQNPSFFKLSPEQKRQVLRYAELAFKSQREVKAEWVDEMEQLQQKLAFSPAQILAMAQEKIAEAPEE